MMDTDDHQLHSRFRGAILGAAIGDALAFPYQHYSRAFLRSLAVPLTQEMAESHTGFHPRGQWSDETQCLLAVLRAITEAGAVSREAIASHLVAIWRDNLLIEPDPSIPRALALLATGHVSLADAGLDPGSAEAAAAARAVPVALWDLARPERLLEDIEVSTRITHRDSRVLACAAAVAVAIAANAGTEEIVLGEFLDRVAAAAGRYEPALGEAIFDFPRILSLSEDRALRQIESLLPDERYPASGEGVGSYCVPVVFTALYYFLKAPYRFEMAVEKCLRVGGRIDTPAFLAGALSGSLVGESGIPARLVEGLFHASEIAAAADELHAKAMKAGEAPD